MAGAVALPAAGRLVGSCRGRPRVSASTFGVVVLVLYVDVLLLLLLVGVLKAIVCRGRATCATCRSAHRARRSASRLRSGAGAEVIGYAMSTETSPSISSSDMAAGAHGAAGRGVAGPRSVSGPLCVGCGKLESSVNRWREDALGLKRLAVWSAKRGGSTRPACFRGVGRKWDRAPRSKLLQKQFIASFLVREDRDHIVSARTRLLRHPDGLRTVAWCHPSSQFRI